MVKHPQRSCVPGLCDSGTAVNQKPGDVPAAVTDRVVEWRADGAARSLQVGAAIDQRDTHLQVVGTGRPVQWRLGPVAAGVVIGICASREEDLDRGGSSGE